MAGHITKAAWHPLASLNQLTVFPEMLTTRYVTDRKMGFASPIRLPLREMTFW